MRLSVEAFLLDANDRAKEKNMKAHCRVVGLGLGFWSYSKDTFKSRQTKFYLDTFADCVCLSTPTLAELCPCA